MVKRYFAIDRSAIHGLRVEIRLTRPAPRLEVGDSLVIFEKQPDDIHFTGRSMVLSARDLTPAIEDAGEQAATRLVDMSEIINLENPQRLTVICGSLERVYRFLDPQRHFLHKIVTLSQNDYETITDAEIHVSRSVFRKLFTALPLAVKAEFVRRHIEAFPLTSEESIHNYTDLAHLLITFIQERMIEPLRMLATMAHLHQDSTGKGLPDLDNLYLADGSDPESKRVQPIAIGKTCVAVHDMLKANRLFLAPEGEMSLLEEALQQLRNADVETENKKWNDPIFR